ncbi:MAG: bifunctional metallophosphatase/5'-nucleotidase, partial [Treponema sp.]|nr:bifunctional metallophosphatase/5'-nucleotidase [Treponema sp.]
MKRIGMFLLLSVFLFVSGNALFASPVADVNARSQVQELILLHTNDHHGAVLPNGGQGGLAELAAYVKGIKATFPNVLLVDAGDINTGSALSNMFAAEPDILA